MPSSRLATVLGTCQVLPLFESLSRFQLHDVRAQPLGWLLRWRVRDTTALSVATGVPADCARERLLDSWRERIRTLEREMSEATAEVERRRVHSESLAARAEYALAYQDTGFREVAAQYETKLERSCVPNWRSKVPG